MRILIVIVIVDNEPYNLMGLKIVLQKAERELFEDLCEKRLMWAKIYDFLLWSTKFQTDLKLIAPSKKILQWKGPIIAGLYGRQGLQHANHGWLPGNVENW